MTTLYMEYIAGISSGNLRAPAISVSTGVFDSITQFRFVPHDGKPGESRLLTFSSYRMHATLQDQESSNPYLSFDPIALRSLSLIISRKMLHFF